MSKSTDICNMKVEYDLKEVTSVAKKIWQNFSKMPVWALHGDMGVGKTTFVRTLCEDILQTSDKVSSPTFALINQYESLSIGKISHIDLYRLHDTDEAINAGVEDAIESSQLNLIEWPEIAPELFTSNTLHLFFSLQKDEKRIIETKLQ